MLLASTITESILLSVEKKLDRMLNCAHCVSMAAFQGWLCVKFQS